jgi:hypothetical protein
MFSGSRTLFVSCAAGLIFAALPFCSHAQSVDVVHPAALGSQIAAEALPESPEPQITIAASEIPAAPRSQEPAASASAQQTDSSSTNPSQSSSSQPDASAQTEPAQTDSEELKRKEAEEQIKQEEQQRASCPASTSAISAQPL